MRFRVALSAAFVAASVALSAVASCSDGSEPNAGGLPSSSNSLTVPPPVAYPKVQTPLDPSPYLDHPCRLVRMSALNVIAEFRRGEPDTDSTAAKKLTGPRCTWISKRIDGPDVTIAIDTVRREVADDGFKGIEAEYRSKESGDIDHLQPLAIPGHPGNPAVIAGKASRINNGSCPLAVGLTEDLTLTVIVIDRRDPQGACEDAQTVAAAALDTLSDSK